jgi:ribosomal protein S18 acetylase RimI-like enzyme
MPHWKNRPEPNWEQFQFKQPYAKGLARLRSDVLEKTDFDPAVLWQWGTMQAMALIGVLPRRTGRRFAISLGRRRAIGHSCLPWRRVARRAGGLSVELKPADPFELIRWLARTQSDPRKAVAELVQNSLDAGAKHVTVHRLTQRGQATLVIRDDGEGVVPELSREEALRYLASHVGHSRKMGLDAAERARRVVAGKYGVGLLGFWAIGKVLELRTRVAGSDFLALRLEEDSPRADIAPLPLRTDLPATFTEAAVLGVHPAAQRLLSGRRLSDYLAAELRGQLLAHAVELVVHDGWPAAWRRSASW